MPPATNWCRPAKSQGRARLSIRMALRWPRWRAGEGADRHRSRLGGRPARRHHRRRSPRARPRGAIFSSPPAAPRSANTISSTKRFAAEGMDLSFWKVAMRPGRPLMHGRLRPLGGMHVLGLPGNPVSAYVCAFLFLVPLIRRHARARRSEPCRPNRPCLAATFRRTTSAPIICAPRCGRPGWASRDALPGSGQFHDGAAGQGRLSRYSRTLRAGRGRGQPLHDR